MKLGGWQKLTLLDFPEHTACTVFCAGCNMRCPFCYNTPLVLGGGEDASGYTGAYPDEEEFFAFLKKRAGLLDGVCVTGGEPTLQPDLYEFIERILSMGCKVKLDTNGTRPEVIERLIASGMLDYIAMDIKSSKPRYSEACGVHGFDLAPVEKSVMLIIGSGVRHEFRTTVSKELHDRDTMRGIGEWLRDAYEGVAPYRAGYFIQSYKDMDEHVGGGHMTPYSPEELSGLLEIVREYIPWAELRGVE